MRSYACRAAVYANRQFLRSYRERHPERLARGAASGAGAGVGGGTCADAEGPTIVGDVYIHPTARIHPTAVVRLHLHTHSLPSLLYPDDPCPDRACWCLSLRFFLSSVIISRSQSSLDLGDVPRGYVSPISKILQRIRKFSSINFPMEIFACDNFRRKLALHSSPFLSFPYCWAPSAQLPLPIHSPYAILLQDLNLFQNYLIFYSLI